MMEKQKFVLEMAKDICRVKLNCNDPCNLISACDALKYAERAYEAGYSKQEWISVEERLPEKNISVLAFYHRVYKSGGSFDMALVAKLNEEGFFVPFNCSPVRDASITHWMPLPEAPKGGAK